MPTDRTPIGLKIKRARERLRITQEELARDIDVSQKTIDNWENDRSYPRSAIGALEARLGPLTEPSSDAAAEGASSSPPPDLVEIFSRYPDLEQVWNLDLPPVERRLMVITLADWRDRNAEARRAHHEQDVRRHA
jgi:DNA-binding XRE family transcriptional regulator